MASTRQWADGFLRRSRSAAPRRAPSPGSVVPVKNRSPCLGARRVAVPPGNGAGRAGRGAGFRLGSAPAAFASALARRWLDPWAHETARAPLKWVRGPGRSRRERGPSRALSELAVAFSRGTARCRCGAKGTGPVVTGPLGSGALATWGAGTAAARLAAAACTRSGRAGGAAPPAPRSPTIGMPASGWSPSPPRIRMASHSPRAVVATRPATASRRRRRPVGSTRTWCLRTATGSGSEIGSGGPACRTQRARDGAPPLVSTPPGFP